MQSDLYAQLRPLLDAPLPPDHKGVIYSYCPGHDDGAKHRHSGNGRAGRSLKLMPSGQLWCQAGCTSTSEGRRRVLALFGLTSQSDRYSTQPDKTSRYPIKNSSGELIAVHVRRDSANGKQMWWELPDGNRGLGANSSTTLPLYGTECLPALPDLTGVVLVEGEKATESLRAAGFPAVGTVGGAAVVPGPSSLEPLTRFVVYLWPDNDGPGREHMRRIGLRLHELGAQAIRLIHWVDAPEKGDAADFFGGPTVNDFHELLLGAREFDVDGAQAPVVAVSEADDEWAPIRPLPTTGNVPPLSPNLLPKVLRPWLTEAAERLSVPLEMVAIPGMVGLAGVVGRKACIQPEPLNDWRVIPNLWGAVIAPPGAMKTAAIDQGLRPLKELAHRAHEAFEIARFESDAQREAVGAEIKVVKDQLAAAAKHGKPMDELTIRLAERQRAVDAIQCRERRYLTQDSTIEKLGELLRDNPSGLLLSRDELAGWLRTLDRPGHEGDREFWLETWNGDGDYTFDRIGRGTIHVTSMTVSLIGGMQPGKLQGLVRAAIEGGSGADGLLQRVQLMVWPDDLGPWRPVTKTSDRNVLVDAIALTATVGN